MRHVAALRAQAPDDNQARGQNLWQLDWGGCYGSPRVEIVDPTQSYTAVFDEHGLLILTGLWKTHKTRFPQSLGRREKMRRPQAQQALLLVSL